MATDLTELLRKAKEQFTQLSPEEQEAMWRKQMEGVAKAEASWPKAKYKWVNGVKVYESYEDYCND